MENGSSKSIRDDLLQVLKLSNTDERHLVAYDLYRASVAKLEQFEKTKSFSSSTRAHQAVSNSSPFLNKSNPDQGKNQSVAQKMNFSRKKVRQDVDYQIIAEARRLLQDKKHEFDEVIELALEIEQAKKNLTTQEDWIFAQTVFGVSTYYRHEEDGSLSVKLDGEMVGVSLFEQFCVLHEIDLYTHWVPFCTHAVKLKTLRHMGAVAYSKGSIPLIGITRDIAFRAVACDCMNETGSIVIAAASIDNFPGVLIPPEPKRFGSARMIARDFQAIIEVLSPTHARTRIITNLDLKLSLPQWLIDFFMKKIAGLLLYSMYNMAEKVNRNPDCAHSKRIAADVHFYRDWMHPKFEKYCNTNCWDMPEVNALLSTSLDKDAQDGPGRDLKKRKLSEIFKHFKSKLVYRKVKETNRNSHKERDTTLTPNSHTLSIDDLARIETLQSKRSNIKPKATPSNHFAGMEDIQLPKKQYAIYSYVTIFLCLSFALNGVDVVAMLAHHYSLSIPMNKVFSSAVRIGFFVLVTVFAISFSCSIAFDTIERNDRHKIFHEGKNLTSHMVSRWTMMISFMIVILCYIIAIPLSYLSSHTSDQNVTSINDLALSYIKSTLMYCATFIVVLLFLCEVCFHEGKANGQSEKRNEAQFSRLMSSPLPPSYSELTMDASILFESNTYGNDNQRVESKQSATYFVFTS